MINRNITPSETIAIVRDIYNKLKLLTELDALAGIVLTDESYDDVKAEFGRAAIPYSTSNIALDPLMEHTFVVDGLLIMRGTKLQ